MEGVLGEKSCLRALTQGGDPTGSAAPCMSVALCIPAAPGQEENYNPKYSS